MSSKRKISKAEGIKLAADELFNGAAPYDIVRSFAKKYGLSLSAIEKWVKAAKIIDKERREAAEVATRQKIKETREEIVTRLGLSLEDVLTEYKKVAFFDIRKLYTVDGGLKSIHDLDDVSVGAIGGVESYDVKEPDSGMILGTTQKVKIVNKVTALDSISKILGYNAPTKVADTDTEGNSVVKPMTDAQVDRFLNEIRNKKK